MDKLVILLIMWNVFFLKMDMPK